MLKIARDTGSIALAKYSKFRHNAIKRCIFNAKNESDVRQFVLTYLGLDILGNLEMHRTDWVHPELWLEFKYSIDMSDRAVRCRVISQILHYLHYAPIKRQDFELPDSFGIVDKNNIIFFDTEPYLKYILEPRYFDGVRSPSAPHPELERALFADPLIVSTQYSILNDYGLIFDEIQRRGIYPT